MFSFLGRLTTTHPWLCCLVWLVAGGALWLTAPAWDTHTQDDDIRFLPARCPSVRGYLLLEKAFPQDVFASRVIFAVERPGGPLTARDFQRVDRLVDELRRLHQEEPALQIGKITSYRDGVIGSRLISADRQCTLVQASLGTPFLAIQTRTTVDRAETRLRQRFGETSDGLRLMVTGPAGIGRDLTRAGKRRLHRLRRSDRHRVSGRRRRHRRGGADKTGTLEEIAAARIGPRAAFRHGVLPNHLAVSCGRRAKLGVLVVWRDCRRGLAHVQAGSGKGLPCAPVPHRATIASD